MSDPEPLPTRDAAAKFAAWLIRFRTPLFLGAVLVTLLAWGPSSRLQFDQSIESLYSKTDPHLVAFRESKQLFGGDELAFVAYTDPELETPLGRERLRKLARKLSEVPGVIPQSVQNFADAIEQGSLPFVGIPANDVRELVRGILVGDDDQTTAVILRFAPANAPAGSVTGLRQNPAIATVSRAETIRTIRQIADAHAQETGLPTFVIGEPVQVYEAFRYVEQDGLWLWGYSAGLLVLVILVLFRSWRWTLLPMLVVFVTVIWTRAVLVISRMELSMVSSMLNSLVTIIGVATVIHVAMRFRERRKSLDRFQALTESLRELGPAIFWTCATTAIGFFVLITSAISPVSSFGWMMMIGTMLVLPAVACCLPLGILAGTRSTEVGHAPAEATLDRHLGRVTHWVETAPVTLSLVLCGLVAFALAGCFWLRLETDFSKNFRASSPIVRGLDFLETRLGGSATWEVNFPAPTKIDRKYLSEVQALARELRELTVNGQPALTKVVCLADGEALIPRTLLTSDLNVRLLLLDHIQPDFVSSLHNVEQRRMRILLRSKERQPSDVKLQIIREVTEATQRHFPAAQTTGLFVLLTYLIDSLLRDQWVSFVLAGAGIAVAMTVAFRRLWFGIICLVPNIFPIILVVGTMGWAGFPINIATAMISSVSMGLTVDSSIHYLAGYQRARRRGLSFHAALQETNQDVGRALVFANFALIAGFLVLTASHFIPLVYFGILVSVAMFGGLIGNLLMLPLLLRWVEPD
jgi:predicted RND superfamily exporter protein